MKAKPLGNNRFELSSGQVLSGVHGSLQCAEEYCTIHNPSTHHMVDWVQAWSDIGMVRVCPHGNEHPDPDAPRAGMRQHTCDGCCDPPSLNQIVAELESIRDDLES